MLLAVPKATEGESDLTGSHSGVVMIQTKRLLDACLGQLQNWQPVTQFLLKPRVLGGRQGTPHLSADLFFRLSQTSEVTQWWYASAQGWAESNLCLPQQIWMHCPGSEFTWLLSRRNLLALRKQTFLSQMSNSSVWSCSVDSSSGQLCHFWAISVRKAENADSSSSPTTQ